MEHVEKEWANLHDRFCVDLPKWPQLMIVGEYVTQEQAEDIILRTDKFLTSTGQHSGGNNHAWNAFYRELAGLDEISEKSKQFQNNMNGFSYSWAAEEYIQRRLGFVELSYMHNTWASSSYIYGPYGFCSPTGKIFYCDNVGKHPEANDIYRDLQKVAEAFPYLVLTATLYSGEHGEDDSHPVLTFNVKNGQVEPTLETVDLREHYTGRSDADMMANMFRDRNEQGLPDDMVRRMAKRVKPCIKGAHEAGQAEVQARIAQREAHEAQQKAKQEPGQ